MWACDECKVLECLAFLIAALDPVTAAVR